jgi:phenylalanyl-tRNA synthetase alpha chain
VPAAHPSRRLTDTYYFSETDCLRTHTSAHQTQFLRGGVDSFLVFGDCYRRDEIDASHYPVFHQVEGVRVWDASSAGQPPLTSEWIVADLQRTLDGLVSELFGSSTPRRWLDDSFPFTSPSLQVEVQFQGRWLEVLGCGVIQPAICRHFGAEAGRSAESVAGWAFGLGLERLAMILFDIPDIRLFWSDDPRFHQQFAPPTPAASPHSPAAFRPIRFQAFSKYPPCPKDLSFFVPASFHENDLSSVIRSVAGDWVESVQMVETFTHPKTGKESRLYRIVYRSMSHSLTNEEVNRVHNQVRQQLQQQMHLQLR